MATIFTKIIAKEIPAGRGLVYEDDEIMAFHDLHPIAPVHILIIPKKEIPSINDVEDIDQALMGKMLLVARNIAKDLNISEKGYKLLFRVGEHGGQEIPHIHLHLIGGARLREGIRPV